MDCVHVVECEVVIYINRVVWLTLSGKQEARITDIDAKQILMPFMMALKAGDFCAVNVHKTIGPLVKTN